jgi:hypothetical protein
MRIYSEDEIQDLLRRAAAMQAARRDPSHGLTLAEIRRIAEEAGIDPDYIDAAAQGVRVQPAEVRTDTFLGGTYRVNAEMLLDHEVDDDEWAAIVAEIRRSMGQRGRAEALGKGYDWRYELNGQAYAHVTLTPRRGRTHVDVSRVNQSGLWHMVPGMLAFFVALLGFIAVVQPGEVALAVLAALAVATVASFAGARALYTRHTRSAARKNADLLNRLATLAGDSESTRRSQADRDIKDARTPGAPLLDELGDAPPEAEQSTQARSRTR